MTAQSQSTEDMSVATDLDLLTRSCERLPQIIELKAPPDILVTEIRILIGLAMNILQVALTQEARR